MVARWIASAMWDGVAAGFEDVRKARGRAETETRLISTRSSAVIVRPPPWRPVADFVVKPIDRPRTAPGRETRRGLRERGQRCDEQATFNHQTGFGFFDGIDAQRGRSRREMPALGSGS